MQILENPGNDSRSACPLYHALGIPPDLAYEVERRPCTRPRMGRKPVLDCSCQPEDVDEGACPRQINHHGAREPLVATRTPPCRGGELPSHCLFLLFDAGLYADEVMGERPDDSQYLLTLVLSWESFSL